MRSSAPRNAQTLVVLARLQEAVETALMLPGVTPDVILRYVADGFELKGTPTAANEVRRMVDRWIIAIAESEGGVH